MGHIGETSDAVSAIMYLESARCVTGEFMHVDGGQSAGHYRCWNALDEPADDPRPASRDGRGLVALNARDQLLR